MREVGCFIQSWIPKYKLLAEENFVYNFFGQRSICGSIYKPSEGLHQITMVISAGKAGLEPPKFMSRVHLGGYQGHLGPMADTMAGDLLGAHGDVMKTSYHQVASGIQSLSSIVRC